MRDVMGRIVVVTKRECYRLGIDMDYIGDVKEFPKLLGGEND